MSPTFKRLVFLSCFGTCFPVRTWADPRPLRPRNVRDHFRGTVAVATTLGVGSPHGFGGCFVELRPWRAFGLALGGGAGGAFGPSLAVSTLVAPLGGRVWALGVEGALTRNFTYGADATTPDGRSLPAASHWLSSGVVFEVRPVRNVMLRAGFGRAWLLDTRAFGVFHRDELDLLAQNYRAPPGSNPLDAARAAHDDRTLAIWYVHLDIGLAWRW